MNSFTTGQLIVSSHGRGTCLIVIDAYPERQNISPDSWWVTVLLTGADKTIGPIIMSPRFWEPLAESKQ